MIYLTNTTDKLQIVTGGVAATVDVQCNYVEAVTSGLTTPTSGRQNTAITTLTTTDVLGAPGSNNTRTLKQMTVRNKDGANTVDVTVQYNANATICEIHKVTLASGNMLIYIEGLGFFVLQNLSQNRLISFVENDSQRIFNSLCSEGGTFLTISGTAYYVYQGRAVQDITPKFVEWHATGTVAAGAQTAEAGLFSTPNPPNKSAQTLTKIVATGTVDSQTSNGMKRNTSAFATVVPAGTHLWAGVRFAMATTQPTAVGLANDMSQGHILTTTGQGALTGLTTTAGGLVAIATATVAPALRVTMD
jgi:hypothetical protein